MDRIDFAQNDTWSCMMHTLKIRGRVLKKCGGLLAVLVIAACVASPDEKRIDELSAMPVLWKSVVLIAEPDMPSMKTLIPLENSYDPGFVEFMNRPKKEGDYIPESVFASAGAHYRNKVVPVTLKLGDQVEILSKKMETRTHYPLYLIKTQQNTYAWLYGYHLQDETGKRIASFK